MDADSSLETIALVLSLIFYALFASVEGYLLLELNGSGREWENTLQLRAKSMLRNAGVRLLVQVGLIASTVVAGIALIEAFTSHWWWLALGTVGLVVLMVVVRGVSIGVGVRWRTKTRHVLPLLWPLALPAVHLSNLQSSVTPAFSRESEGVPGVLDPSIALGGGYPELQEEELALYEHKMITSILKLDESSAREIMISRMDILAADATSSLSQVARLMWESGHSRIPLYEESLDNIVGVVHSRDMLRNLAEEDVEVDLSDILRPPLFIPDTKRLDDLLRDFQENHIQIAIVVDEYGGTAGLVTIEDLLEEIVGEIEDEFDIVESMREMINSNEALMDARISLEEVNHTFDVNLQGEGFDTLGGLLYQKLGKIPGPGDEIEVDGLTIKVISTLGRRIKKVQVSRVTLSESH